jgi:DNA-binding MarR family transcriptional regulator
VTKFAGGPADSPGFLMWRTTLRWQRAVADALAPLGLTHVQFVLLACAWWLGRQGRTPNQLAIAAQAATDVKMTSEVLRRLEGKGLVVRRTDPADSRAKVVAVTEQGAQLAVRAVAVVEQADGEFFADIPESFVGVLRTLSGIQGDTSAATRPLTGSD